MGIIFIVIGVVVVCFFLFLKLFGTKKATVKMMKFSYASFRELLGPEASEQEVLYRVLQTRPPFDQYPESSLRGIVEDCSSIDDLTAFVIGWDRHAQGRT